MSKRHIKKLLMIEKHMSAYLKDAEELYLPGISVDVVILGYTENALRVLLLKLKELDYWALPGGFIYKDEDVDTATHRIVQDRTGLNKLFFNQFQLFGKTGRNSSALLDQVNALGLSEEAMNWLDRRFLTVGYFALVKIDEVVPQPDILSERCDWFPVDQLPVTFLDHGEIVHTAIEHVRRQLNYFPVGLNLLPEKFTMSDLQKLYECILNEQMDRGNFQRKMLKLDILVRQEKLKTGGAHKAPFLYKFDIEKYKYKVKHGIGFI